jgi:hypothetical protein
VLGVLLALGMQGIISATSLSGVKLVSVNKDGTDSGNGVSRYSVISADGRFVAFCSWASDLVATDTNGSLDVFAFDQFAAPQGCNCADPSARISVGLLEARLATDNSSFGVPVSWRFLTKW